MFEMTQAETVRKYPRVPGWRSESTETSKDAARAVEPVAVKLQSRVLAELATRDLTSEEVAERLRPDNMDAVHFERFKRSVGCRVSELVAQGLVVHTNERRKNQTGFTATVWTFWRPAVQKELGL